MIPKTHSQELTVCVASTSAVRAALAIIRVATALDLSLSTTATLLLCQSEKSLKRPRRAYCNRDPTSLGVPHFAVHLSNSADTAVGLVAQLMPGHSPHRPGH